MLPILTHPYRDSSCLMSVKVSALFTDSSLPRQLMTHECESKWALHWLILTVQLMTHECESKCALYWLILTVQLLTHECESKSFLDWLILTVQLMSESKCSLNWLIQSHPYRTSPEPGRKWASTSSSPVEASLTSSTSFSKLSLRHIPLTHITDI